MGITLEQFGIQIEEADPLRHVRCRVENGKLIAKILYREDCEVEVFTPYELKLFNEGKLTGQDLFMKRKEICSLTCSGTIVTPTEWRPRTW